MTEAEAARLRDEFAAMQTGLDKHLQTNWKLLRRTGAIAIVASGLSIVTLGYVGLLGWALATWFAGLLLGYAIAQYILAGVCTTIRNWVLRHGRAILEERIRLERTE